METQKGQQQYSIENITTLDQALKLIIELISINKIQAERILILEEEIRILKKKLYGKSSERSRTSNGAGNGGSNPKNRNTDQPNSRVRSLTEQYPNAEVEDQYLDFKSTQICSSCDGKMIDSGLEDVTEQLQTIPAKHKIIRQHRRKHKCPRCYGGLVTAPSPPRIAPGSSLGNSFIIEAAKAKFYYLIPAQRYALMVSQCQMEQFPPQLVLAAHHYLAEYLHPVYKLLQRQIQQASILFTDETPHRMLEGSEKKSWYTWGFTAEGACCFQICPTRSADIAIEFLLNSSCLFLMSDVYSGYIKAIREVNAVRRSQGKIEITPLYCNAHSRRKFAEALIHYPDEAQFFIDQYKKIYQFEAELQFMTDPKSRLQKRTDMKSYFESMAAVGKKMFGQYSDNSAIIRAIKYYLNNYQGLTKFLENPDLPIDNNISERQLRNPVIGRKTWYGTHSERGAQTTAILFSIMQSCKYLKIDPRKYLNAITHSMFAKNPPFTPSQYLDALPDKISA